ncbi:MAG: hypothetical protein ACR2LQ_08915 [Acidimicrobiales bacterium]
MIGASTALHELIDECAALLGENDPEMACSIAVRGALATHRRAIALKFADARDAALLHRSTELTALVVPTPPRYWDWPHENGMWLVTAMLIGAEDDIVYDRHEHGIVERRRFHIDQGIVAALPADAIHSGGNDSDDVTVALCVYGGDPLSAQCLEWDPRTGRSRTMDDLTAHRRRSAMASAATAAP